VNNKSKQKKNARLPPPRLPSPLLSPLQPLGKERWQIIGFKLCVAFLSKTATTLVFVSRQKAENKQKLDAQNALLKIRKPLFFFQLFFLKQL